MISELPVYFLRAASTLVAQRDTSVERSQGMLSVF
jgi:hypothetical protein